MRAIHDPATPATCRPPRARWARRLAGAATVLALAVGGLAQTPSAAPQARVEPAGAFSIVVLPDTQGMVDDVNETTLLTMIQWILAEQASRRIAFVTHVGDVVEHGWLADEWARAAAALRLLDGRIPYSVAMGNHDYRGTGAFGSDTSAFRTFFGPAPRDGDPTTLAWSPNGLSHLQRFEAGGATYLHLSVEFEGGPVGDPDGALAWAKAVLTAHPDEPTILTTHAYLWDEPGAEGLFPPHARQGILRDEDGVRFAGHDGQQLYEALVAPFPQVFLVLCGHFHEAEGGGDGAFHRVTATPAGATVLEMLSDFQDYPRGGNGFLRIVTVVPGGGAAGLDRLEVETFSPLLQLDQRGPAYRFTVDLTLPRAPSTAR